MSQFTDDLAARMQTKLTAHFARMPGETAISIPVKMIARAVEEMLADGRAVPEVPKYDAELAAKLRWSGLTADLASFIPPTISADVDGPGVVLTVQDGVVYSEDEDAPAAPAPIVIEAMPDTMRAFALHLLSVCDQAERGESMPELHGAAADAELEQREIRVLGAPK
jgi:hypothetical protein